MFWGQTVGNGETPGYNPCSKRAIHMCANPDTGKSKQRKLTCVLHLFCSSACVEKLRHIHQVPGYNSGWQANAPS